MLDIKTFSELEKLKNILPKSRSVDIKDQFSTPGLQPIGCENGLFYWEFSEDDVREFVIILEKIKENDKRLYNNMILKLKEKCNSMVVRGISPIGSLLYATKTINKYMNNMGFSDEVAEILYTFNCNQHLNEELEHILKKWNWTAQLKIAIKLCGKIGNVDLLTIAYNRFYGDENLKVDIFKALMDTGREEAIPMILYFIKNLDKENEKDRQIANYFRSKIYIFLPECRTTLEETFKSRNISPFGKKVLSDLITDGVISSETTNNKVKNLSYFIELAKIAAKESKADANKKKQALEELYNALNQPNYRGHVMFALRFTNIKEAGNYIISTLKNNNCNKNEIKQAIMTLGFLAYTDEKEYILDSYLNKIDYKVYVWAYLALIKDESYIEKLASELFEEKTTLADEVSSVIKQIYKSVPILKKKIVEKFNQTIISNDHNQILKSIKNLQYVNTVVETELKPIIIIMFDKLGYSSDDIIWRNEKIQDMVLSLVREFVTEDSVPKYIENFLFYVMNSNKFSGNIRFKARNILNNINPGGIVANG